ncbi:MAG: dihydrofolate reductase family protein [Gemmatimonadaceae bacterium]
MGRYFAPEGAARAFIFQRRKGIPMANVLVFNSVSLDGFFTDASGDMSWAHKNDPEWNDFTRGNAKGESTLLFGRKTYEMMAGFWPSPQAKQTFPEVADAMNRQAKVVFSKTLDKASWSNTRLLKNDLPGEVRKMKQKGTEIVILGSGTIVAQLTQEGLVDQYQVIVNPIVLGKGRTMFDGVTRKVNLKLTNERRFKNGNVLLTYEA